MPIVRFPMPSPAWRAKGVLAFLCALALSVLSASSAHADTLINFDDLPSNVAVDSQYVAKGVLFDGVTGIPGTGAHISSGDVTARSPKNVLINSPFAQEFGGGPVTFTFTTPQKTVSLFAGYVLFSTLTKPGTMQAFDASGKLIPGAIDGPKAVTGGSATTPFSVASTTANIAKVTLDTGAFSNTVIDDLQFGGGAVISPPSGTPVVTINRPTGTTDFVDNAFSLTGSVNGQGLLTNVKVVLQLQTPPPTVGFPTVNNGLIALVLNGTGGTFDSSSSGSTASFGKLLMGTYLVTVTATNLAGATGSASTTFTNFPPPVALDGTSNSFGAFQFAQGGAGGCEVATFVGRSVAYFPSTGRTIEIPLVIATKWLTVSLGCPLAPDIAVSNGTTLMVELQDFVRGRIYAQTGMAATYTPKVFVDAISAISSIAHGPLALLSDTYGINEVGIPIHDPTSDVAGEEPTILFQQFARSGYPGVPNTLEIRGRNPKLYIERVGGSMFDFLVALGHTPQPPPGSTFDPTPTIWESYDCNFHSQTSDPIFGQYTCAVTRPQVLVVSPQNHIPMYTDANQIDDNSAYCPDNQATIVVSGAIGFAPTTWSGVPLKANLGDEPSVADTTDVLTKGWITHSQRSSTDLPSVHEHVHCSSSADAENLGLTIVGCGFSLGLGCLLGHDAGQQVAGNDCWSDWNIHIRPLALAAPDPNLSLLRLPAGIDAGPPFWNLLAVGADPLMDGQADMGDMENEWEADWQNPWVYLADNHPPREGNLLYLNGRWIIDCAHPPYHSEIHPPNAFLAMEMAPPPAGMVGLDPSNPVVTRAQIWVNQFYEGQPFGVTVWPPPRPAADAQLTALYATFREPGGFVANPDGSLSFSFTNDPGVPVSAGTSMATSALVPDGLSASFSGSPGTHNVEGSGQVTFPPDDPGSSSGAVGSFMANWYVGWSRQ